MLADAEYFNSRISKLEGSGDLGPHIVEIVKNKTVIADSNQSQSSLSENGETPTKMGVEKVAANGEPAKA